MAEPSVTVAHILHEGHALCGQPGLPAEWPSDHRWVGLSDLATPLPDPVIPLCLACVKVGLDKNLLPPNLRLTSLSQAGAEIADQRIETYKHIAQVQKFIFLLLQKLQERALAHDHSKLLPPESTVFQVYTPKLAQVSYNSPEYKRFLEEMKPALSHHYLSNSHHPEHFPTTIKGMSLLDLLEMFCDWKAATLRHNDGDIRRSIQQNQARFGYSDELKQIFFNTLEELEQCLKSASAKS